MGDASAIRLSNEDDVVINNGLLLSNNSAGSRETVNLFNGDDIFEVQAGSQIFSNAAQTITGIVDASFDDFFGIGDTLRFGGTTAQTFDLGAIGVDFINFERFQVTEGLTSFSGTTTETFSVENSGTLSGEGTFGNGLIANSGGTIAPGNSIGTITVNGEFTLNAGSTLVTEVTQTAADQVNVIGTVTINDATAQFDDLAPALEDATQTFVIINNDGTDAVQGTGFANIVDNLAFLTPLVTLTGGTGNDVELSFVRNTITTTTTRPRPPLRPSSATPVLSTIAATPNHSGVAAAFDALPASAPGVQEILDAFLPLTNTAAQAGLSSLSGEIFGSSNFTTNTSALFIGSTITDGLIGFDTEGDAGTQTAENTLQALALAPDEAKERLYGADLVLNEEKAEPKRRHYVFSRGLFRDVQIDDDGNGAETDVQNRGFVAGGGIHFNERFSAGIGVGYLNTEVEVDAVGSEVEGDSAILNIHARYQEDNIDFTANLGYLYTDFESDRQVTVGAFSQTARADFDSNTVFGNGEIGYTARLDNGFALRPFAGAGFSVTDRDGFSETGAGAANLNVESTTDAIGQLTGGASVITSFKIKDALLIPRLEAAVDYLIGDVTPATTATFQPGGLDFTSVGTEPSRARGRVNAGLTTKFTKNLTGFIDYQGTFSRSDREHAVRSGLKFKF